MSAPGIPGLEKSQVVGQTVSEIVQTPWVVRKGWGIEGIPPVGDGNQYSTRFILCLDNSLRVELLWNALCGVPERLATQKLDVEDFDPRPYRQQPVLEVVIDEFCGLTLVFPKGAYLQNFWGPSGNGLWSGRFDEWSSEDKAERYFRYWERDAVMPWELRA